MIRYDAGAHFVRCPEMVGAWTCSCGETGDGGIGEMYSHRDLYADLYLANPDDDGLAALLRASLKHSTIRTAQDAARIALLDHGGWLELLRKHTHVGWTHADEPNAGLDSTAIEGYVCAGVAGYPIQPRCSQPDLLFLHFICSATAWTSEPLLAVNIRDVINNVPSHHRLVLAEFLGQVVERWVPSSDEDRHRIDARARFNLELVHTARESLHGSACLELWTLRDTPPTRLLAVAAEIREALTASPAAS